MKSSLLIIYLMFYAYLSYGSCFGPKYTLTEILANQENDHHIFTCKIIATYHGQGGYNSVAVVTHVYRGNPFDTVYIVTGGNTFAGGSMIIPETEWLIISETRDNKHYTATICHNLSRRIDNKKIDCSDFNIEQGNKFLSLTNQYFKLVKSQFSGKVTLAVGNEVFAQASFLDGKSDGKWQHFWYSHELNKQLLYSEYHYKSGIVEGHINKYLEHVEPKVIFYESLIKSGLVQWEKWNKKKIKLYNYQGDTVMIQQTLVLSESGDTLGISTIKYLDFKNDDILKIWYYHGYYYNMENSGYNIELCEGHYHLGARVGLWKFFNTSGEVIHTEEYNMPTILGNITQIYDTQGNVAYEGKLKNGQRVGLWKQYYKGILENEFYYNMNSKIQVLVRHYSGGGKLISTIQDGKIHGIQKELDSQGQVKMLCHFNEGVKNGIHVEYDTSGKITQESVYKHNRETTLFSTSTNAPKVNGFSNGYNIQFSHSDGHKMYEGEIKMGYNVGKHIHYNKNGSFTVTYHPFDINKLMYPCKFDKQIRMEFYNKDGELISTEEY